MEGTVTRRPRATCAAARRSSMRAFRARSNEHAIHSDIGQRCAGH
jgi:hypothetical protein